MTIEIPKSFVVALPYDFVAEVAKYIAALEAHRDSGDAAPHSYAEVEVAVRRLQHPIEDGKPDDFVADYVIVDDTPPPPSLAERKVAAIVDLRRQEQAEIDAVIAPERRRLQQMTFSRALRADPKTPADEAVISAHQAIEAQLEAISFRYAEREADLASMV